MAYMIHLLMKHDKQIITYSKYWDFPVHCPITITHELTKQVAEGSFMVDKGITIALHAIVSVYIYNYSL